MNQKFRMYTRGMFYGVVAALVLIAASLVIRLAFGVGTVAELGSDRIAPFMSIPFFFKMLGIFGGYSHLKEIGIVSALATELLGGAVVGVLYLLAQQAKGTMRARRVTSAVVGGITLLLIAGLWPNLAANYSGLPPTRATVASVMTLLVLSSLFLAVLFWSADERPKEPAAAGVEAGARRRWLLSGAVGLGAGAIATVLLTRFYRLASYRYDGTENAGEDLPPITPNEDFYQVTKNNVDPQPKLSYWRLEIGGDVSRPRLLRLGDILAMPAVVQETTLQCISNQIGAGLSSNALWKGVPLAMVLQAAGMSPATKQIRFHAADGFIDDLPIEKALDEHTLLVYQINGESLPQRHGFPVRLLVPGQVGEKSVKWLTRVEAREVPGKGFYEQQGWGPQFTVNNTSRFDAPDLSDSLHVGQRTVIRGTAFSGDRGVGRVEVSTDGAESWQPAEITYRGSDLAWVQWRFPWQPAEAGDVDLVVRCIDKRGGVQMGDFKPSGPEPVQGYQRVTVTVDA